MKLNWTIQATRAVKEIYAYRKETAGVKSAQKLRRKLFDAANRLRLFPKLGRLREETKNKNEGEQIRELTEGHFKIFYVIEGFEIDIIFVTDTRANRDLSFLNP